VVWAIGHCIAVFKGQEMDAHLNKLQALAIVMHLVGDNCQHFTQTNLC